jgi:hypothetical protein
MESALATIAIIFAIIASFIKELIKNNAFYKGAFRISFYIINARYRC